jgi:biofilm PGA synthesis lipoprotein PgaB
LRRSFKAIEENAGVKPLFLAWPYGLHSQMAGEEAAKAGFKMTLSLDDGLFDAKAKDASSAVVPRHMAMGGQSLKDFAADWQRLFLPRLPPFRALQADLDLVWDADPAQQERNLDAFVERLAQISPGTVLLQAYSDDLADGNVRSVYFPNKTLPMKADLFNRACRSLQGRGMKVFAWMPSLAIVLPDAGTEAKLRVMEAKGGAVRPSRSWYSMRLSPFSAEAAEKLKALYASLAASAPIDGVIFQDDCYLNDFEDFNPAAIAAAKERRIILNASGTPRASDMKNWTKLKTGRLNQLTLELAAEVRRYRPDALFARTLYAPVVAQPKSEEWFAQSYPDSLRLYDYAVIMAYPKMEKAENGEAWLAKLVESAKKNDPSLSKTVFKLQSYDWEAKKWIAKGLFRRWVEALKRAGAENLAYYPDDYSASRPEEREIKNLLFEKDEPPLAK